MFAVGTVQAEQGWEKPSERISLAEACGRWIVSFSCINSRRKDFTCRNYQKIARIGRCAKYMHGIVH